MKKRRRFLTEATGSIRTSMFAKETGTTASQPTTGIYEGGIQLAILPTGAEQATIG